MHVLYIRNNKFAGYLPCIFNHPYQYLSFSSSTIVDGDVIYSNEGTTQGDPLAMPFYALSTVPLICKLPSNFIHTWYADDASACGQISHLRV